MGSDEASKYWVTYSDFLFSFLTVEEMQSVSTSSGRLRIIIETHYEDLVIITIDQKSRLAFQVLGVYLMDHGAKMSSALRELILIYSSWENERDQLFDERDKAERYHYLSEFREKIRNYKEGIKTTVSWETNNQIVHKLQEEGVINSDYPFIMAPERRAIDYNIKDPSRGVTRGEAEDIIHKIGY